MSGKYWLHIHNDIQVEIANLSNKVELKFQKKALFYLLEYE